MLGSTCVSLLTRRVVPIRQYRWMFSVRRLIIVLLALVVGVLFIYCLCAVSPVFVTVPSVQTVVAQSRVAWRCVVTANPSATITWSKDGGRLDDVPNAMISHDGSELTLTNVSRLDAGEYSCTATNDIGINTVSAQLEIHGTVDAENV